LLQRVTILQKVEQVLLVRNWDFEQLKVFIEAIKNSIILAGAICKLFDSLIVVALVQRQNTHFRHCFVVTIG
jgi:uncharacterized protein YjfI (DUF2170 family)